MRLLDTRATIAAALLAGLTLALSACGKNVTGTYSDPRTGATVELKSNGDAAFNMMGITSTCTYKTSGSQVTLTCPGQGSITMTVQSDGSLAGDQNSPFPVLKKSK